MEEIFIVILLFLLFIIIYLYIFSCKENFTTHQEMLEDKISLYIFLTNNCKFCKEFEENKYDKLVEDIGDKFTIKKIYLNNDTENLFIKYNIRIVPSAVLEINDNIMNINDGINKETIMKAYDKLEKNRKKELLIFLSKKCPYCVEYLLNTHKKIIDELNNDYNIKLIFSDEDNDNLFTKYKINYVPKSLVISNNIEYDVKGTINSDNIYNADKIKNTNINKKKILVFLSKTCPHCIKYDNETHNKLNNELKDKYEFEKIYDDINKNEEIFKKYNVQYVPKLIILNNNEIKEVNGSLTSENILKTDNIIEHMIDNIGNNTLGNNSLENNNFIIDQINNDDNAINDDNDINNDDGNYDNCETEKKKNKLKKEKEILYKTFEEQYFKNNNKNTIMDETMDETMDEIIDEIMDETINKTHNETIDETIDEEVKNNKIVVFLSKTCPGCIDYLKYVSDKLESEYNNEFTIENKFLDEDKEKLFEKYKIEFVPQAMIFYNNKMEKVDGNITINNIKNTIDRIKNKMMMNMIENTNNYISDDKTNYKKITTESFSNILEDNNTELLVFLSKTCHHCMVYDKNTHSKLEKELQNRCTIKKIYADDDKDNLFNKYNIQYVPKGIILSRNRYIPIEGALNNETIRTYLEKINN
jgi:thiol-disulfide isomerase/thioredoxin